jgi:uncharacterized protein YbjT (DUF2867 family)
VTVRDGLVLVTTAAGNVGREVVRACSERGIPVRGADRSVLDFLDPKTWPSALSGCDRLFLLRPPPISDMERTLIPFVDAAYAAGVQHVVFMSVAGAERRSWVPHRKVELHLERIGRAWTILRPGFFAQNVEDAYRRDIVEDDRLYVPAGRGRVAFVDVRDIGDVAALVLDDPSPFRGQALTQTGPRAIGFDELAALLTKALGRAIEYQPAAIAGYAAHLRRHRGMSWTQIAVQTILHLGLRRGDAEAVDPSVERLLGRPARSIESYVGRVAAELGPGR